MQSEGGRRVFCAEMCPAQSCRFSFPDPLSRSPPSSAPHAPAMRGAKRTAPSRSSCIRPPPDGASLQSRSQQLAPVGLHQVQVQAPVQSANARRALRQEKHGVFVAHHVRRIDLVKKLARILELRFELRKHLFADRIAAGADARANGGNQILGPASRTPAASGPRPIPQSASPFPASRHGTRPPRAACGRPPAPGMQSAVWMPSSNPGSPVISPSAFHGRSRPASATARNLHQVRMKLPNGDQRRSRIARNGLGQQAAVAHHRFPAVVGRKAQVQLARRIVSRNKPGSRRPVAC